MANEEADLARRGGAADVPPVVGRVVSILNLLAGAPGQSFSLSDIAKALGASRATCHAMLASLVDAGYLHRRSDKRYELGPAVLALAVKAPLHASPISTVRQELRMLADELDVVAAGLFPEGNEVVVLERAASVTHLGWTLPAGQRYPRHPWGVFLMERLAGPELEAEIDRIAPDLAEPARREVREQIEFARFQGYFVGLYPEGEEGQLARRPSWRPHGRFTTEIEPSGEYPLMFLVSCVHDRNGQVAFGVALYGFIRNYDATEIARLGERLKQTCRRLTTFVAGRG
jgi:DNA-binding IclR family transcriptional regulator